MAEAVSGTRVPNSQTSSELIHDPTRRALLTAIPAAAIATAALAPAARALASQVDAEASDERFLAWETEWSRRQDSAAYVGKTDDEIDALADQQRVIERLIFETPSSSRIAAQVKIRTLIEQTDYLLADWHWDGLDHVLAALEASHG